MDDQGIPLPADEPEFTSEQVEDLLLPGEPDLRLISSVGDVGRLQETGKNLVIVVVGPAFRVRIFDGDGDVILDADEGGWAGQARQIEDFRGQLRGLLPPHKLNRSEKSRIIDGVTSIFGRIQSQKARRAQDWMIDGIKQRSGYNYDRCAESLVRLIWRICRIWYKRYSLCEDYIDTCIDDIIQDIFVRVYIKIIQFNMECAFIPWLKKLSRNMIVDHLRKVGKYRHHNDDMDSIGYIDAVELEDGVAAQPVAGGPGDRPGLPASLDLSDEDRSIILCPEGGLAELARGLGIKPGTLRQKKRRLLRRLRGDGP